MAIVVPKLPTLSVEALPRLAIVQAGGTFTFNDMPLLGELMHHSIMLGLVRQRSWWDFDSKTRMCGSVDFEHGTPGPSFPWYDSNFDPPTGEGLPVLQCGNCSFKDWKPNPLSPRRSTAPECREQYQVPIMVPDPNEAIITGEREDVEYRFITYMLGFITFQKSSQQAAEKYMKDFQKRSAPLYTQTTKVGLKLNLGPSYKYSVPTFTSQEEVYSGAYPALSAALAAARAMLTSPPKPIRAATGGMLDVSVDAEQPARYSGTFFN